MKHYAKRDIQNQKFYLEHVFAMTSEGLHSKSDIAAELAHRDKEIFNLKTQLEVCLQYGNAYQTIHNLEAQLKGKKAALSEAYATLNSVAKLVTNHKQHISS